MQLRKMIMSEHKRENLQEFLYTNVKGGNWKRVVEKYAEEAGAQGLKLTQSGDTALHLAVFDNQEEVVSKLVKLICGSQNKGVLGIKNERHNNPLHVAAAMGSARMCQVIALVDEGLVDDRNKDGETPLFLAALHGHKNAFYCLHDFCRSNRTRLASNCRRNNADTVIHCALRNEQFDLAFQIINMNNEAASWVDGQGLTPLHILASKPTAFKSGAHIKGRWHIVYACTCVHQLKPESAPTRTQDCKKMSKPYKAASFPRNYDTCIAFFTNLWEGFLILSTLKRVFKKNNPDPKDDEAKKDTDLENDIGNQQSENFETDEAHECSDTGLLKDDQSANRPSNTNFPQNYRTCIDFFQVIFAFILIILGFGYAKIRKIREKKQKHTWSVQVMEKLLELAPPDKYFDDGNTPMVSKLQTDDTSETLPYTLEGDSIGFTNVKQTDDLTDPKKMSNETKIETSGSEGGRGGSRKSSVGRKESAMLLAAKNGVMEMVKRLFEHFPLAIRDTNLEKKNALLLAAEYRQPGVYRFLLDRRNQIESVFRAVDINGNSALHLAANVRAPKPWRISGAALQMLWEVKWYRFVKSSVPLQFFAKYNNEGKLAKNIFHETHKELVTSGGEWLTNTSESCSVLAALIATVAFASATTIPGGNGDNGIPPFENEMGFFIFALSSLIALCLSCTSVIMFLAILTSRFNEKDFRSNLPWKLLIGLSSLFFSIVAMLVSFCAAHYFLLSHRLGNMAVVVYIATSLPVACFFAIAQLPLYYDLLLAIVSNVPKRQTDVFISE